GPFRSRQVLQGSHVSLLLLQGSAHSNLSFAGMRLRDIIGWFDHLGSPLTIRAWTAVQSHSKFPRTSCCRCPHAFASAVKWRRVDVSSRGHGTKPCQAEPGTNLCPASYQDYCSKLSCPSVALSHHML
ncbi:hypothetical protein FOFC_00734, partial [Fusarium oxysporum]